MATDFKKMGATAFLGVHFALRILKRITFLKSPNLKSFREFYAGDRLATYTLDEKKSLLDFGRCISCGLCDVLCPSIEASLKGHSLGVSFMSHVARSTTDFVGNIQLDTKACEGCAGCESVCPERVPLRKVLNFIQSKSSLFSPL